MKKLLSMFFVLIINIILIESCFNQKDIEDITPNQFKGSDIQRIQSAINAAKGTTNKIVIPSRNSNGTNLWLIDSTILLPSNMTVILENCTIKLSDKCRDNMFRSNNVGIGITDPKWNRNISIIGIGDVVLKGADYPRSTGDAGGYSFGSDVGKDGMKQTGDWRNIMILMACVDSFKLKNVTIENAHAWAISFEKTINADISDIRINSPERQIINGKEESIPNRDGIDILNGCKNFRIDNISGRTGDDFIALSSNITSNETEEGGGLNSTMVTTTKWRGPEDDTEQIFITNIICQSKYRGIAIRAYDSASINNVYINGLIYGGNLNAILVGGKGYGKPSLPGRINNIRAMNIMGKGRYLIHIEEPIADCYFMNGMYSGEGDIITYNLDETKGPNEISDINKDKVKNVISTNMMKTP